MIAADNNVYIMTFFISLAVHTAVLFPIPLLHYRAVEPKPQTTAMNYLLVKLPAAGYESYQRREQTVTPNLQKQTDKNSQKKAVLKTERTAPVLKPEQHPENNHRKESEKTVSVPCAENKQVITRGGIAEKELAKDKTYINYYKLINLQLRRSVVYPQQFFEGEVALSFVLSADGSLCSVEITNETIVPDASLREAAIQIVKNASPFPPFPESLQKKELTFNVVICFRERT